MTSMCGSGKNHAVMNAGGYYRRPYTYVSFIFTIVLKEIWQNKAIQFET